MPVGSLPFEQVKWHCPVLTEVGSKPGRAQGAYGSLLPAAWRSTGELEQWLGMLFMHHDGKPWEIFGKGGAQS